MARAIEYSAESLLDRLSILEVAQFKYAGSQAIKRFGFEAKQHHGLQMAGRFENPVNYTLSSVRYEAKDLEVILSINPDGPKGNAPATYIFPADKGTSENTAYVTRFARGLRKAGITTKFPVPYTRGRGVRVNRYGNMTGGQYQQVLSALRNNNPQYFSVPDNRSPRPSGLPSGIYMRTSRGPNMLFGYQNRVPSVRQNYDFEGITRRLADQRLPKLLRQELTRALR